MDSMVFFNVTYSAPTEFFHCIRYMQEEDAILFGFYYDPHNNEVISLIPIIFCCLYFVFHYLCLSSSIVFCYFESTYGPNACWDQAVHETILFTFIDHSL